MQFPQPAGTTIPVAMPLPAVDVAGIVDGRQIDDAVDYAARVSKATVSEFLAAPAHPEAGPTPQIELAVEFFVPPADDAAFARELDRALARRSMTYAAARRSGSVGPVRVTPVPGGAFHQWRSAWNVAPRIQHDHRWSADRGLLDGLLRQASTGWREPASVA